MLTVGNISSKYHQLYHPGQKIQTYLDIDRRYREGVYLGAISRISSSDSEDKFVGMIDQTLILVECRHYPKFLGCGFLMSFDNFPDNGVGVRLELFPRLHGIEPLKLVSIEDDPHSAKENTYDWVMTGPQKD